MTALIPAGTVPTMQPIVAGYAGTLLDFRNQLLDFLDNQAVSTYQANLKINEAISRCSRELRIPEMEKSVTVQAAVDPATQQPVAADRLTLPTDFLEVRSVDADGIACYPVSYNTLMRLPMYPGRGSVFARDMGQLVFRPTIKQYVRLVYYGAFSPMVNDTDTTEMLSINPACLQWAALSYLGSFMRMDETADWEARYQQERDTLNQKALDVDTLGQPQQVQAVHGYNPWS